MAALASRFQGGTTKNALTFDVEDYYQVSGFESIVRYEDWDRYESRVERNTYAVLDILSKSGTRATFFVLGWIAERFPGIVKAIHDDRHEVASHGYRHKMLTDMNPVQFREDIRRSKSTLEDLVGHPVIGFRAPSFTIMKDTIWALDILAEEGFLYDSSIFPIRHDRYGMPEANPFCHQLVTGSGQLWEIPPSTFQVAGKRIPIAGGGYFRLFPYWLLRRLLSKKVERVEIPLVMYFHPWELDPDQPRLNGSWLSRFRHYVNLHKTEKRLCQLLRDFAFAPIRDVISPIGLLYNRRSVVESGGGLILGAGIGTSR